jgi:transposase-like protein
VEQDVFTRRPPIFSLMDVAHWAPLLTGTSTDQSDWLSLPFVNRFPDGDVGVLERHRNVSPAFEADQSVQTPDDFSLRDFLTEEGASALLDSPSWTSNPLERSRESSKESQIAPQSPPADDLWQDHLTDFLKEFEQLADRFTPERHLAQPSDWFVKPNDDEPVSHFSAFASDFGNQLTESPSPIWDEEQDKPSDVKPLLGADKDLPKTELSPKAKPAKVVGSKYTKEELDVKKQAVIKDYQSGETSPSALSRKHQLPQSTVSTWLKRFQQRPDSPFFKLRHLDGPSKVQTGKRKRTDEGTTDLPLLSPTPKRPITLANIEALAETTKIPTVKLSGHSPERLDTDELAFFERWLSCF